MMESHRTSPCPKNDSRFTTGKNNNWNYWITYFAFWIAGWIFFRLKHTSFGKAEKFAALSSAGVNGQDLPNHFLADTRAVTSNAFNLTLGQSGVAEPACMQLWDCETGNCQDIPGKNISAGNWPETSMFYPSISGQVNQISSVPHSIVISMNSYYTWYFS